MVPPVGFSAMRTLAPLLGITLLSLALPSELQARTPPPGAGVNLFYSTPTPPRPRPSQAFVGGNAGGIVPVSMNGAKGPVLPGRTSTFSSDPN
jgi:hypothetical protein